VIRGGNQTLCRAEMMKYSGGPTHPAEGIPRSEDMILLIEDMIPPTGDTTLRSEDQIRAEPGVA
jgi:hypothetical protein